MMGGTVVDYFPLPRVYDGCGEPNANTAAASTVPCRLLAYGGKGPFSACCAAPPVPAYFFCIRNSKKGSPWHLHIHFA